MPAYTVIAGPNGSGKSTLIDKLQEKQVVFRNYHNADDIARTLGGGDAANRDAQRKVQAERETALNQVRDFTYETVMSHPSHVDSMVRAAAAGFRVMFCFVATDDPDLNVERVATRVAVGKHNVPEDRIRKRYKSVMETELPRALLVAHRIVVYDNTRPKGEHDDPEPRLIFDADGPSATFYMHPELSWPEKYLEPHVSKKTWPYLVRRTVE